MTMNRREALAIGAGAIAAFGLSGVAAQAAVDEAIAQFTGGADAGDGGVVLTTPEIAENGNTVPIEFAAPGATAVAVFGELNPVPLVVTFKFGPLNPSQSASTRIRLAKTQNVIAVAQMADGSFSMTQNQVKVTIGGCGG